MNNRTYFNRNGKLYVRENLGQHNKRVVKSLKLPIGRLEIQNNRVVGHTPKATEANAIINRIEVAIKEGYDLTEAIERAYGTPEQEDSILFGSYMKALIERSTSLAPNTIKTYLAAYTSYIEYADGKELDLIGCDILVSQHRERAERSRKAREHWAGYVRWMKSEDRKNSTIQLYLEKFRSVLNKAKIELGVEVIPPESVTILDVEPFVWSNWLIKDFLKTDMGCWQKDAANLAILTCLRPSDLLQLKAENFQRNIDGGFIVQTINNKGKSLTKAPIPEEVWRRGKAILHLLNMPRKKWSENLKSLLCDLGYDKIETVVYQQNRNRIEEIRTNIAAATTPHTMRKNGVNWYISQGLDENTIRRLYTGHKSGEVYRDHYVGNGMDHALKIAANY